MAISAGASNPAYTVALPGQNNGTGASRANFLSVFGNRVHATYNRKTLMSDYVTREQIADAKTHEFPLIGSTVAGYLPAGHEITGGSIKQGVRKCSVDDLMYSAVWMPRLDDILNHFEVAGPYADKLADALAQENDRNAFRTLIKAGLSVDAASAARNIQQYTAFDEEQFSKNVTVGYTEGGQTSAGTTADNTNPDKIAQALVDAKRQIVKADLPTDGLVCVLNTDTYFELFNLSVDAKRLIFDRDFGGGANLGAGEMPRIMGIPVMWSNNFDLAAGTGLFNADGTTTDNDVFADSIAGGSGRSGQYDLDNSDLDTVAGGEQSDQTASTAVLGAVFTRDAVCQLDAMSLTIESEYQIERKGNLTTAHLATGFNVFHPGAASLIFGNTNT